MKENTWQQLNPALLLARCYPGSSTDNPVDFFIDKKMVVN